MTRFDFDKHEILFRDRPFTYWNDPLTYALVIYGELDLARTWLEKMIAIHEKYDCRSRPSLIEGINVGSLNASHSLFKYAGLSHLVIRLMRAMHTTFNEIDATSELYYKAYGCGLGWETDQYCLLSTSFFVAQIKRR